MTHTRSVLQLEDWPKTGECLFPYGESTAAPDSRFCKEPVARSGAPYCGFHLAACYVPAKKKPAGPSKGINWKGPMQ